MNSLVCAAGGVFPTTAPFLRPKNAAPTRIAGRELAGVLFFCGARKVASASRYGREELDALAAEPEPEPEPEPIHAVDSSTSLASYASGVSSASSRHYDPAM